MKHCMLDTETLGLRPGYAILSIGAVQFDLDGQNDKQFYANISPQSCTDAGLLRNPETMKWWTQQSEEAQNALIHSRRPLKDVLEEFVAWWREAKLEKVWSQGAAFDVPIVEYAMATVGIEPPWKFFNVRDTRTLYDAANWDARFDTRDIPRQSTAHIATNDCLWQIACVAAAWERLNGRREPPPAAGNGFF